jgi:PAS domain S-box-containing protein
MIGDEGLAQSVVCVSHDITDQKMLQEERENLANEQRALFVEMQKSTHLWETTFDSLSDLISIQDHDFRIVKANKAYCAFTNKKPSEIIGKHCYELMHCAAGPVNHCPYKKSLSSGTTETLELTDEKTGQAQEITTSPHYDEQGRIIGAIHVVKDTTARKNADGLILEYMKKIERTNEDLKAAAAHARCMTEKAQRASEAKNHFLATISHEIRTPLNGVMGMSELLMDTTLNAEQNNYARIIRSSAHSLLTMVTDILDFSKIEAGKMDLDAIDFDIQKTLLDCILIFKKTAADKGLALALCVHPSVPKVINGDPVRFGQVLSNLIGNAIKFTEFGSIAVSVSVEKELGDSVTFLVEVKDTGIGIAEDKINTIFDCFSRIDNPRIPKHCGTGLGLSISKRLVGLMDGRIGVSSAINRGSHFWFTVQFEKPGADDSITEKPHTRLTVNNSLEGRAA